MGGKLFITGQDIGYDLVVENNGKEFYNTYLHAQFVKDDCNCDELEGVDEVFSGLNFEIAGEDGANNQEWPMLLVG